jgi:hypothetical protein
MPLRVVSRIRSKRFSVCRCPGIHDGKKAAGSGTPTCHKSIREILMAPRVPGRGGPGGRRRGRWDVGPEAPRAPEPLEPKADRWTRFPGVARRGLDPACGPAYRKIPGLRDRLRPTRFPEEPGIQAVFLRNPRSNPSVRWESTRESGPALGPPWHSFTRWSRHHGCGAGRKIASASSSRQGDP